MKRKYTIAVIAMMLLAGCSLMLMRCTHTATTDTEQPTDSLAVMVMQIQKCNRLYTAEAQVHKIVTHGDQKRLQGSFMRHKFDMRVPGTERKVALPIDATVKAYIDFAKFGERNIRRQGGKIEIILPDPKMVLTSSCIDHQRVKEYVPMVRSNYTDAELAQLSQQGRDAIIVDIPRMNLTETARISAANILIPMLRDMGYAENDITVTFRSDFNANDVRSMLVTSDVEQDK